VIVADTNIISYFYLTAEYSSLAEQLYAYDPDWAVPLLWRSEFRNVLSLYVRKKIFLLPDAVEIFEAAELLLRNREYEINGVQVLRLAQKSGCSAYDCEFVSLAQDLHVPLVTMDKGLLAAFPESAVSLPAFLEKK
jgi:predicted nucleic acid-binding protein